MNKPNICSKINQYKSKQNFFFKKMTIKIALISEKESSVEEAQRKKFKAMKDKLLKEKEILPEQLMMNDSRSVRISANKITKKKHFLKVLKSRTSENKR